MKQFERIDFNPLLAELNKKMLLEGNNAVHNLKLLLKTFEFNELEKKDFLDHITSRMRDIILAECNK